MFGRSPQCQGGALQTVSAHFGTVTQCSVDPHSARGERSKQWAHILAIWVISSKSKSNSTNFLPRWRGEALKIWKRLTQNHRSFDWPERKSKSIKKQFSCVQDNKQTNKQNTEMTPRLQAARRKKLKFRISCQSERKQRNGSRFSENMPLAVQWLVEKKSLLNEKEPDSREIGARRRNGASTKEKECWKCPFYRRKVWKSKVL